MMQRSIRVHPFKALSNSESDQKPSRRRRSFATVATPVAWTAVAIGFHWWLIDYVIWNVEDTVSSHVALEIVVNNDLEISCDGIASFVAMIQSVMVLGGKTTTWETEIEYANALAEKNFYINELSSFLALRAGLLI